MGKAEFTLSDTQSKGLALPVRKTSAAWCLRGRLGEKQTTWHIADARNMLEPDQAREAAAEAWKLIKRGIDPSERLREIEYGGPIERHFDRSKDGWTWEEARDKYIEHVQRDKAAAIYRDYRTTLRSPDLRPLDGLLVKQITPERAKRIQDAIADRGVIQQARHTIHILKGCMAWVAERAGSGISESPIERVKPMKASLAPKAHRAGQADEGEPCPKEGWARPVA